MLSDADKRARYDKFGHSMGPQGFGGAGGGGGFYSGGGMSMEDILLISATYSVMVSAADSVVDSEELPAAVAPVST